MKTIISLLLIFALTAHSAPANHHAYEIKNCNEPPKHDVAAINNYLAQVKLNQAKYTKKEAKHQLPKAQSGNIVAYYQGNKLKLLETFVYRVQSEAKYQYYFYAPNKLLLVYTSIGYERNIDGTVNKEDTYNIRVTRFIIDNKQQWMVDNNYQNLDQTTNRNYIKDIDDFIKALK